MVILKDLENKLPKILKLLEPRHTASSCLQQTLLQRWKAVLDWGKLVKLQLEIASQEQIHHQLQQFMESWLMNKS
jgi:phosphoribosylformylglycinamidine (FGAM) synthase PurS component